MNPLSFLRRSLGLGCLLAALTATAQAANTPTDPVGVLRLRLRGGSDTVVSLPLQPVSSFECAINSSVLGQIQLPTFISLPGGGAYLRVMTGALEGAVLPITGQLNSSTIRVDAGSYDLSVLKTEFDTGTGLGDLVALVPYWTLDALFPAGANLYATTNLNSIQSQVLVYDDSVVGTNLAPSASYFYYAGDGTYSAGWYRSSDMSAAGSTRLPPNHYFLVRQPVGALDSQLLVTGQVPMASARLPLATRAASKAQDNLAALPVPVPVSLGTSLLVDSGAFTPTTSLLSIKDQLLVFNNAQIGQNKSASASYIYFAGNASYLAGWYKFGDMSQRVPTVLLNPGEGYIIRKASSPTPKTISWVLLPAYLQ